MSFLKPQFFRDVTQHIKTNKSCFCCRNRNMGQPFKYFPQQLVSVAQRAKLWWLMHLLNWVPDNVRLLSEFAAVNLSPVITAYSTRARATVKTLLVIATVLDTTLQVTTRSPVCKPDCAVTDPSCNTELSRSCLTLSFTYIHFCTNIKRTEEEAGNRRHHHKEVGVRNTGKREGFLLRGAFPRCIAHVHHHYSLFPLSLGLCAQLWYFSCEESDDSGAHSATVLTITRKKGYDLLFSKASSLECLFSWRTCGHCEQHLLKNSSYLKSCCVSAY